MKGLKKAVIFISSIGLILAIPALAGASGTLDITAGLGNTTSADLAGKIITIATGFGALAGAVGAAALIYLGFKLKVSGEQERAYTKQHIIYVFGGMGLVAFAVLIAGFTANLMKG